MADNHASKDRSILGALADWRDRISRWGFRIWNWLALDASGAGEGNEPSVRSRKNLAIALCFGVAALVIYNGNMRAITSGDTYAARYLPLSIWRNQSLYLDPIISTVAQGRATPAAQGEGAEAYWIIKGPDDRFVSRYPIVTPVLLTPLYAPAALYLQVTGWEPRRTDEVARLMEKICASLMAALSVGLLYLLMRRRTDVRTAGILTAAYAFGTNTWVISSQALWSHGLSQLLLTSILLFVTGRVTLWRVIAVGVFCGLVAANRPPDAILVAGLGLYALWWARRLAVPLIAAAITPVLLLLVYNLAITGHIVGGYGLATGPEHYSHDVVGGVAGLLFSPTRGLFVFSPFLLFIAFYVPRILCEPKTRALTVAVGGAVLAQVLFYALIDWRQGISFGPRWLTDMLPMLMWLLPPVLAALSARRHTVFSLACGVAFSIQIVGAFWYTGITDISLATARGPERMQPAWDVRNAAFIAALAHPPVPGDLLLNLRGGVDFIRTGPSEGVDGARELEIQGWTLAGDRAPASVDLVVDGTSAVGIQNFHIRPDISRTAASGWRLAWPIGSLAPGVHRVAVLAQARYGGEARLLLERSFIVPEDGRFVGAVEGPQAARRASQLLTERQQGGGYWLTAFTGAPAFESPTPELNTYLNAVLIDLAGPVAARAGLTETLERTRTFLTDQIEAGGLVRYHGLPAAPGIGTLGCVITPDSDDTALVWRVAPRRDRQGLSQALAVLEHYRRPDGLYRTWLAPRDRYQCLDPGRDPNPADLTIQMHIFLMMARERPATAGALCAAMIAKANDDEVWAYYQAASPVPILRLAEVRRAGCPLRVARPGSVAPDQSVWVGAASMLQQIEENGPRSVDRREAENLLRRIATDDFALVRHTPPLLYHNDHSATVKRYYWSMDFGYALWLRLYFATEPLRQGRSSETDRDADAA